MKLRHIVLPVFYVVGLTGLCAAVVVQGAHPTLANFLIGGTMATMSTAVLAIELIGARLFAQLLPGEDGAYLLRQTELLTRGYSWSQRASYLGQAIACWIVTGTATVVMCHLGGVKLRGFWADLGHAAQFIAAWPIALRIVIAFLVLDAWSYCRHRIEHSNHERGLLWRYVHRWHHTPTEGNMWTGMVVHPLEAILVFAWPTLAMGALGYERREAMLLFAIFLVLTMPQHMNSGWTAGPLGALIHGPEAHTRHHSTRFDERNANYADCLTLWDRLFGTYRKASAEVFRGPFGPE